MGRYAVLVKTPQKPLPPTIIRISSCLRTLHPGIMITGLPENRSLPAAPPTQNIVLGLYFHTAHMAEQQVSQRSLHCRQDKHHRLGQSLRQHQDDDHGNEPVEEP